MTYRSRPLTRSQRRDKNKRIREKRRMLWGEREVPKDGIERMYRYGHSTERCVTPDSMQSRREELYARSGSECEGCGITIYLDTFHLHHFKGKGRGRCDGMCCIQALCPDAPLSDGTIRYGCHTLQHQAIDEHGKFDPNKSTRLGQKFERQ